MSVTIAPKQGGCVCVCAEKRGAVSDRTTKMIDRLCVSNRLFMDDLCVSSPSGHVQHGVRTYDRKWV